MPFAIFITGPSGSGKTTLAKKISLTSDINFNHYEADSYFYDVNGNYNFDPRGLKYAHDFCFFNYENALALDANVIVSNTFTTNKELEKYILLAEKKKYKIFITYPSRVNSMSIDDLEKSQIHGVPKEIIKNQLIRWNNLANLKPEWNEYVIIEEFLLKELSCLSC